MITERTMQLACSPQVCLSHVSTSRLLKYVSWPMICFECVGPDDLPEVWEEKCYVVKIRLFCFIPLGKQNINITSRDLSTEKGVFFVELRDNGSGTLMSKWDHVITITDEVGGCLYSDRVEIKAGVLTPIVTMFAWFFYRHRQRRWQNWLKEILIFRNLDLRTDNAILIKPNSLNSANIKVIATIAELEELSIARQIS